MCVNYIVAYFAFELLVTEFENLMMVMGKEPPDSAALCIDRYVSLNFLFAILKEVYGVR